MLLPQRYVFSSKSQLLLYQGSMLIVVVATTKVRIFKQITTLIVDYMFVPLLLLLPQRYVFSSKSQQYLKVHFGQQVVVATTKVRIFKQITTCISRYLHYLKLLLLPQRYVFSSKSQLTPILQCCDIGCCCYHKGTYFQANHNIGS